jgi:acetyl-CoA carboxylase carboxyltransferase component
MNKESLLERFVQMEKTVEEGDPTAVEKQHKRGRLTARERISKLVDPGSFNEVLKFAQSQATKFGMDEKKRPNDGVICGYGTIDGRRVHIFAQDRTVLEASVGGVHGQKIADTIESSRRAGVPCIGLLDSVGARLQESLDSTTAVGRILYQLSRSSGHIPMVAAVMGTCAGIASYSPALADIVMMVKGGHMFITGPKVVKTQLGEDVTLDELGGVDVHSQKSGLIDLVYENDEDCLEGIKRVLRYLPSNAYEIPGALDLGDSPDRQTGELLDILPDDHLAPYDVRDMIRIIVDKQDFLELKPSFAKGMVIGFGRLDERVVGFVANQNLYDLGSITIDEADKAARFVRFCDSFNIPIITIVDSFGVSIGTEQARLGILRHGAKMMYAYSESAVPKVTLMVRKGYGGVKQAMCTKDLGADQVIGWPFLDLDILEPKAAVEILYQAEIRDSSDPDAVRTERAKEFEDRFRGSFDAATKGFVHQTIHPKDTRKALISAFRMFRPEDRLREKRIHGNMPL